MKLLALALRALITIYQYTFSAITGPHCRYHPTCSAYAKQAIETHGALRGTWMAVRRIGRCHPWGGCGHDPVPPASAAKEPS